MAASTARAAALGSTSAVGSGSERRPLRIIGVVVIAFAIVTGMGGLTGAGILFPSATIAATERTDNVVDVDGTQVVTTEIGLDGYFPANAVVYVDEPVTWVLDPVGVGCASIVNADSLGLGQLNAIYERVESDFTPAETGTFTYQCAMGMYSGSITARERPADATS
jgi:hypothetical protein